MIVVSGKSASARRTCATDSASPPMINCRSGCSACGISSIATLKSDEVSHAIVTSCRAIASPIAASVGLTLGDQDEPSAVEKGAPHFERRRVELRRGRVQQHLVFVEPRVVAVANETHDGPVRHFDRPRRPR